MSSSSSLPTTTSAPTTVPTALTPRDPNTSSPTKAKTSSSPFLFQEKLPAGAEVDMDVVMKKKRTTEEEATVDNVVVVGDKEMKSGSEGAEVGEGGERQQGAEGGERQQSQSMEFHRKVLEKRLGEQGGQKQSYISPSDTIMSPCTAKLSAYRSKHFLKAKPQSLLGKLEAAKKSNLNANGGASAQNEG